MVAHSCTIVATIPQVARQIVFVHPSVLVAGADGRAARRDGDVEWDEAR